MIAMHPSIFASLLSVSPRAAAAILLLAGAAAGAQQPAPLPAPAVGGPASTLTAAPQASMSEPEATDAPPEPAAASSPAAGSAYTASTLALAFSTIDGNNDGKLSRNEAAGFRGVAKYFDQADVDRNGSLSREEFGNAMNRSKAK